MEPTNPHVNPSAMQTPPRSSLGPVIGLIIILAIIVVGSLYFWGKHMETRTTENETSTTQTTTTTQNASDDLNSIESDLNATSFTDIDAGIEELQ